ncbi:MAG TPA: hypothetical protein VMV94_15465 [Phycisphaerae bacterium]|nr:hypothetical protein [Phycisphaerae bacterium]
MSNPDPISSPPQPEAHKRAWALLCMFALFGGIATRRFLPTLGFFVLPVLALPGCFLRCVRYRYAFDLLVLLAVLFLLVGLVAQRAGEAAEIAWGLGPGDVQALVPTFAYFVVAACIAMALIEANYVTYVRLRLRLKDRTRQEKLLFWLGFTSLGRPPAIVESEARAIPRDSKFDNWVRERGTFSIKLSAALGVLVLVMFLVGGFAILGRTVGGRLGGDLVAWGGAWLLIGLSGSAAYAYWLWRITMLRHKRHHGSMGLWGKKCLNCGYDLRGLRERRCPECGTPF